MPQPLNSKESSLFRQVIRNYDLKQYKKGLRAADQILRKNPQHGDTTALKALIINSQGRSEDAFALAKAALKMDMKSHVCWHVYGLIYRAANNLEEAMKAYKFALKIEPDSPQIQRDLASLQIQMRDYQGYVASRHAILQNRPGVRQNWTALAVAQHLAGNLLAAENVLTTYEDTLKQPPPKTDVEHSEALLYKNSIIAGRGEYDRALEHLEAVSKHVLDRTTYMEFRADYLLRLERSGDAESVFRILLERNPENRAYYRGLERSLRIEEGDKEAALKLYKEYAEKGPRADAPRRIPLDFLEGSEFREAADQYLRRMLAKGVPSTFANVKGLYGDSSKKACIQELVEGYASGDGESKTNGSMEEADGTNSRLRSSALVFLAQHYDYYQSRNLDQAMEYIERALENDAATPDLHMIKARIWKHRGNPQTASQIMDHARSLDERDRYINSKASKYLLRNHANDAALKTMSKFTRNETPGGPLGDLHDMQCMWYIIEDGESYARQGKLGHALKRLHAIYDIFDVWQEDQFDFHSFSLRKGQVRAYIEMLQWEDRLRSHPFYARAALQAVQIYILLHDRSQAPHSALLNGTVNGDHETASERKKAHKKAKREQQKKEKTEAAQANENQASATAKGTKTPHKVETDPTGSQFAQTAEPLKGATRFLQPLLDLCPGLIESQLLGFELLFRRRKYLLALKCLHAAAKIDRDHPLLHQQIIRFYREFESIRSSTTNEKVSNVLTSTTYALIPESTSLTAYNDAFLTRHTDSAPQVHSSLRVRDAISPETRAQNEQDLLRTLTLSDLTIDEAKEGLLLLQQWRARSGRSPGGSDTPGKDSSVLEEYQRQAKARWPHASIFERDAPRSEADSHIMNVV